MGINVPGGQFHLNMSIYADDNTGIFTSDGSMKRFFRTVSLFQAVSGSNVNYTKYSGMFAGKWKRRSDHPFGISWIKHSKDLGYRFGYELNDDFIWNRHFTKLHQTLFVEIPIAFVQR